MLKKPLILPEGFPFILATIVGVAAAALQVRPPVVIDRMLTSLMQAAVSPPRPLKFMKPCVIAPISRRSTGTPAAASAAA